MESRIFLLLGLAFLIFSGHSQGLPETYDQSSAVSMFTASNIGEPPTPANRVTTSRPHTSQCNCKGAKRGAMETHCPCQPPTRRNGNKRLKIFCQKQLSRNLRRCQLFSKPKTGKKSVPSVPL